MHYKLRALSLADVANVAEIEQRCHQFPMSIATLESCFGRFYHVIGLEVDGDLVGFAILHLLFEDATLMDICVSPENQGKGLGRVLLDAVVDLAASGGAERIMLEVRASSSAVIRLYEMAGFVRTGLRVNYYQHELGKEDAVLMERLL